jgi:ferredoxin--NADP+ reductase
MPDQYYVAVIGAGPAGLFAARELARAGVRVVLFNRDIKPGGLAEYGIYPDKFSMKDALRSQFRQVLDTPEITYYGNMSIGKQGDMTLDDLRACGFQAILVTAGAQGTKWLSMPGEHLTGVYHAKGLVAHYNRQPDFSQTPFHFGKRAAVVGAGNVMLDITRYLVQKVQVDEVVAIVRRGPVEVKFDKKEMEYVIKNLDLEALDNEINRVTPQMTAIGQDPAAAKAVILEAMPKAQPTNSKTRFRFEFLASPSQIQSDENDYVSGLEVEDNSLSLTDSQIVVRGTGHKRMLDVESVVFAIGDTVDDAIGLPVKRNEFIKNPAPRFPIEGVCYEVFDPDSNAEISDIFVAGWSRQASTGLVGYARKDGTNGAKAVLQYLKTIQPKKVDISCMEARLDKIGRPIVTKEDVSSLSVIEQYEGAKRGVEDFKFSTNEEMVDAILTVGYTPLRLRSKAGKIREP